MDIHRVLSFIQAFVLGQTNLRNYTTITLFTDPKTWNEAHGVCHSAGGHLLDINSYALFAFILDQSQQSPWNDVPLGNGPPIWIGLHRNVNIMGEEYYSTKCEALSEFRIVYWKSNQQYTEAAGPESGFCVYDEIQESRDGPVVTTTHGYTRAECSENHPFFCQSESTEPCQFERVPEYYGDTSNDYSPGNDITLPFTTTDACAERCLSESIVFLHEYMNILEECWGYSITPIQCIIHIVVKPSYFSSVPSSKVYSTSSQLFLKKCFEATVNNILQDTEINEDDDRDESDEDSPDTGCGHLDMGESRLTFVQVIVFEGRYTWNDGLKICRDNDMEMLHIRTQADYTALAQVVEKHKNTIDDIIWLGIHEPDPLNKPSVRLWSDCEPESLTNWDDTYTDDVYDTNLCVVIDVTSSFTWKQAPCNDQHHVICMGETDSTPSYSVAQSGVTGDGVSLGPIRKNGPACKGNCSSKTYNGIDCWGFARLTTTRDFCYLYFALNSTFYEDHVATTNNSFSFRRKMIWTDKLEDEVLFAPDVSIFPYSCCDMSDAKSQCPSNTIPSLDLDTPTTRTTNFVLYTVEMTWNDAVTECTKAGGQLLQLDTLSKYHVITRYISDWIDDSLILTETWIGLSQLSLMDPCSLRWTQDCNVPHWVNFENHPYNDQDGKYCVAFGKVEMIKAACDDTRRFICEIDSGRCSMESSYDSSMDSRETGDTLDGTDDVFAQPDPTSCPLTSTCLTAVQNGQECWATVDHVNSSCSLLFHTDPLFYKDSGIEGIGSIKICFTSSIQNAVLPPLPGDARPEPHNGCYVSFSLPITRDEERCNEVLTTLVNPSSTDMIISPTTTVSDASSTNSISPSDVSTSFITIQSVSSSTASLTTSLMLGTTSSFPPVSTSTTSIDITPSLPSVSMSWSQIVPTTAAHNETVVFASPIYLSPCFCRAGNSVAINFKEWQEWLNKEHEVHLKNTSRYRRAVTCAWDNQSSSLGIGTVAISVFIVITVLVIAMDVSNVARIFKYIHGNRTS